jgi:hypothetical protein
MEANPMTFKVMPPRRFTQQQFDPATMTLGEHLAWSAEVQSLHAETPFYRTYPVVVRDKDAAVLWRWWPPAGAAEPLPVAAMSPGTFVVYEGPIDVSAPIFTGSIMVPTVAVAFGASPEPSPLPAGWVSDRAIGAVLRLKAQNVRLPVEFRPVLAYLSEHQALSMLLPAVGKDLREEFGSGEELSLELYRDPEFADEYLTLYVRQVAYDSNVMDRIERVGQSHAAALEQVSGTLLITTDFRPPGAS